MILMMTLNIPRLGGGTLAEKAATKKKMQHAEFCHHMTSLAYALCYIHHFALRDHVIIHRDIKCANIFLTTDGVVKLGDLNVSKVAEKGLLSTQTGTPYYACPEVWLDKPYDNKSDVWSLGCVLYEMVTLLPPFRA